MKSHSGCGRQRGSQTPHRSSHITFCGVFHQLPKFKVPAVLDAARRAASLFKESEVNLAAAAGDGG